MPFSVDQPFTIGIRRSTSAWPSARCGLVGIAARAVEHRGGPVRERARGLGGRLHREQHALHVGVLDDRRGLRRPVDADRLALQALARPGERALVGALGDRHALEADREARGVHHDEHVLEAAVRLADEVADGAVLLAVGQHRRRARVDAELVLDRDALHVVARAERAVVLDQELRHDEERDALHALGRAVDAREHEVDDVLGVVVLAVGDEDLLALDSDRCRRPAAWPWCARAARSLPACGSVRFIVPVHLPETMLGRNVSRAFCGPRSSIASIAPCVSIGQSLKARFAEPHISSTGAGHEVRQALAAELACVRMMPFQPFTVLPVGVLEARRRRHLRRPSTSRLAGRPSR